MQENVKLRRLLQLHQKMIAHRRLNIGTINNNNTFNDDDDCDEETTTEDIIDTVNNNTSQVTKLPCLYCPKTFSDAAKFSKHLEQRHLAVLSATDLAKQAPPIVEYLRDKMTNNVTNKSNNVIVETAGNVQLVQNMQVEIETLNQRLAATQQSLDEERQARQIFEEGLCLKMMGQVEELRKMMIIQAKTKTDEDHKKEEDIQENNQEHSSSKYKKIDKSNDKKTERPKELVIEQTPTSKSTIEDNTTLDSNTNPIKASVKQELLDQLINKLTDNTKVVEEKDKNEKRKTQQTDDKKKMVEADITNTLEERLNSYLKSNIQDNEPNDNNNNNKSLKKDTDQDRYGKAMDEVKRDRDLLIQQSRHDYNFVEIEENIRNKIDSRLHSIISQQTAEKGSGERPRTSSVPILIPNAAMSVASSRFTLKRVTDEDLKREEEEAEEERQSRSLSTSPLKSILKSSSSQANGLRNRSQSLSGKPLASQLANRRISFSNELTEYQISPLTSDDSSDEEETMVKESLFSFETTTDNKDEDGAIVYFENPR